MPALAQAGSSRRNKNELFGVHPLGCKVYASAFDAPDTLKGGHRTVRSGLEPRYLGGYPAIKSFPNCNSQAARFLLESGLWV